MSTSSSVPGLDSASLMVHMQRLCKRIGPRPPASPQEHAAGEYVKEVLRALGLPAPTEQAFRSQNSIGWVIIPSVALSTVGVLLGLAGRWGKLAGAALFLLGLFGIWQMLTAAPVFFRRLIQRWPSRNLFVELQPTGEVRQRLFLVGHLDTQKQRFTAPIPWPQYHSLQMLSTIVLGAAVFLWLLLGGILGWQGLPWYLWIIEGMFILTLLVLVNDELQPHIEGANDNATAVSILLGMAGALRQQPLAHTAVTLLFTGCEEVPCVGMEAFLKRYAVPVEGSYWIDLEMVGTGSLCYITRHGMSPLSYYPHPKMVQLAESAAREFPVLGVTGRPMLIIEEVANLRRHGYQALCLAGYNAQGFLPNWHRLSDRLENIEPATLERAAMFTWALAQEVDCIAE